MKKIFRFCMIALVVCAAISCKEKKQDDIIIIKKPIEAKQTKPKIMASSVDVKHVDWVGSKYTVKISQKPDTSLPLATDGSNKYYDNRITVEILRSDGTPFFKRTFSKADFKPYVAEGFYKGGALQGIVFDRVDGQSLRLAASVGNPDKSSDEYVPLNIAINNFGAVSISESAEEESE